MTIYWYLPDRDMSRGGIFIGQSNLIKTLRLKGINIKPLNSTIAILTTIFGCSLRYHKPGNEVIWIDGIWHSGFSTISFLWRILRPNLNLIIMPHGMLSAGIGMSDFPLKKEFSNLYSLIFCYSVQTWSFFNQK